MAVTSTFVSADGDGYEIQMGDGVAALRLYSLILRVSPPRRIFGCELLSCRECFAMGVSQHVFGRDR